jgi:hypothetical protein
MPSLITEKCDMLPVWREADLIIRELAGETLVYDRQRHKAHCLNRPAAVVWRHCDGKRSVDELAAIVQTELGVPVGAEVVQLALARLHKCHLLQGEHPRWSDEARGSRRDFLRKLGVATVAVPVVMTIFAPTAAAAASRTTAAACASCNGAGLP